MLPPSHIGPNTETNYTEAPELQSEVPEVHSQGLTQSPGPPQSFPLTVYCNPEIRLSKTQGPLWKCHHELSNHEGAESVPEGTTLAQLLVT